MLAAVELIKEVEAFEKAGAIAVVVEAVPAEVAKIIYERSGIPILGTGRGPYSDSPMINFYDLLGFYEKNAKFAKEICRCPRSDNLMRWGSLSANATTEPIRRRNTAIR